jgi:hypothetical protein
MNRFEGWVARHRRRLSLGVVLGTLADALAVFLLAFGTAVLVVKLARPGWWPHVLWLGLAVLPVAAWAWRRGLRLGYSRSEAVAHLDQRVEAGGLLMTLAESFDERWAGRLPALERSSLPRLRPVRAVKRLALPLLFALGSVFVPLREARTATIRPNIVGTTVAEALTETLEILKQNEVLEAKEAEELKQAIQKFAQEAKDAPLTHESWEVVDALRDKMKVRAQDSFMAATQARDAVGTLSADALKDGALLSAERREQLQQDAFESLRKMSKAGKFSKASPELQKKLRELMKEGKLALPQDPAERERFLTDLKAYLDAEAMRLAEARGETGDSDEDDEFNDEAGPDGDGDPGRGGVNRGRGDAKLTWGDESEADGIKFKESVLPPGTPDQPNKEVISQSAATPEVNPAAKAPRAALRAAEATTGQETWNRTLRPRHRAVVRKYFDSSAGKK